MKQTTPLDRLYQFQNNLFQKTGDDQHRTNQPLHIGSDVARLRARLVLEEAQELADALESETPEQVLKELCDLLYVAYGTAATFGLNLEPAFNRVHRNNMHKIDNGAVDAGGKLIKAPNHPKVDLSDLVGG